MNKLVILDRLAEAIHAEAKALHGCLSMNQRLHRATHYTIDIAVGDRLAIRLQVCFQADHPLPNWIPLNDPTDKVKG